MKIAVDVMGGDFAPESVIDGILESIKSFEKNETLLAVGPKSLIEDLLKQRNYTGSSIQIIDAPEVIEMGEHPTKALTQKPNSSIGIGFGLLKAGKADVFASAGNTGAMMVGSLFSVKTLPGIQRPAIAGFAPRLNGGYSLVLDIGANADCKPEMLNQWAHLGSVYYKAMVGVENPRVALMNIGEEEQKGSILAQAAHSLMKANSKINFIGNIEGKDFFFDKADVIVTDGFTGNIMLKMGESFYSIAKKEGVKSEFIEKTNYETYGGSPIIGINGNVIIAHGASSPKAIENMIHLAKSVVKNEVYQKLTLAFQEKETE